VTRASFSVPINDDNIFDAGETFSLTVDSSSLPSRVMLVTMCRLEVTIADNDCELMSNIQSTRYYIDNVNICSYQ